MTDSPYAFALLSRQQPGAAVDAATSTDPVDGSRERERALHRLSLAYARMLNG